MKRKLLIPSLIVCFATLTLSSCMRNSYPQFTGRYHPKIQDVKHPANIAKHNTKNEEQTTSLSKLTEREPVLSSVDLQPQIIGGQSFTSKASPHYTPAHRKLSTPEIVTGTNKETAIDKTTVAGNKVVTTHKSSHSWFKSFLKRTGDQLLCAIIAIFIPFLGVALYEDGITVHFWIDLILCLFFWIPGIIYALIVILAE